VLKGSTRPTRTAQVRDYLAGHGFPGVGLHRSARDAYCYFYGGDADYWHETSVMVPRISDLTLDQWLAEARTCAATARRNPAHRSGVTMSRRRTARRRRTNPVGMDAMYHALQQPRIPWASFSVDQIKTVAYGAMKNGDNELYDKAVAALARRSR